MTPMSYARGLAGALALGFLAQAFGTGIASAQDGAKACTCQNLESLQQDYQNAVYLERAFRKLSDELRRYEAADLEKGRSRDDTDAFGDQFYADALKVIQKEMPFQQVSGYTGPEVVPMPPGTCEQDPELLDAMAKGSACSGMADPALLHEFEHRELCKTLGAAVYWSRLSSELAAEEADRYKIQAANLKSELRKVLEEAKVELHGTWRHTLSGQGMEVVYLYETATGDIGGASKADTWTMAGKGETSNSIESMKVAGLTCSSAGAVRHDVDVAMTTDGLTFGLELQERRAAGEVTVNCGYGQGMSLPTSDVGSGSLTSGQALVLGDNPLPQEWAVAIKLLMKMGGMTVSGEPEMVLSVSCPAP